MKDTAVKRDWLFLPVHKIDDLVLRKATKRAYWKGGKVNLTVRQFDLVDLLFSHRGTDISSRKLYDTFRGRPGLLAGNGPEGYRVNLRVVIMHIRKTFKAIDPAFDEIETFAGFGYRWK
ncbi:hypothetical protein A3D66_02320 [Candidatus Kaiserbacteria bacterium RIFCSPHIGHO2_02_FULL_50_9]|uniref:OmpR/PhoB-type domain-containing protein n=1 Tax=Candidatus Kaiserbacteria bacterium RIFCSPLOWO2_01_FULL_51_21 TaxID=1798508 RepID=A0A1F6EDY4_9BACT|nr:MAG: hypothetical protein A2761_01465 [Candidatus Kaiserbacteria bacterium RIFCSPHIGHO2_01_FULL_51_33]OGG63268.1 MAG: hypothetical protein A3D66_02320 [Candidatus Kaiserbacteria bacterium RIFCSPHIGHO2_02_FULL_50_9]OGG71422.1 MAG: hypothetical protein A3A35_01615 [Candidatus Kaiserbacteria bacterium RIFCSPLOWO2_01_FULL_51_21]